MTERAVQRFRPAPEFARRLRRSILRDESCRPRWASSLRLGASSDRCLQALVPFCAFGLEELKRVAGPRRWRSLAPAAKRSLARHLWERLAFALKPTLKLISKDNLVIPHHKYRAWKTSHREIGCGLAGALMVFPSVVELISLILKDWIKAQDELFSRLEYDVVDLSQIRGANTRIGRIELIRPGLSDSHGSGRTVTKVRFCNGRAVIYKPRVSTGEELWSEIIEWINGAGFTPVLRTAPIVPRKSYSWGQFLSRRPCKNLAEIRQFYIRWGAQAALLRIFGFADLHHENWIASGSHPILVDAEMFGPDASRLLRIGLTAPRLHPLLATGLLPFRSRHGANYHGAAPFDLFKEFSATPKCWPRLRRKPYAPADFSGAILRGFASIIEFIWESADRVDQLKVLLERSHYMKRRVLIRSTQEYWSLLAGSLHPRFMLSLKSRYPLLLQICSKAAPSRQLAIAEARSLLRCCIPHVVARRSEKATPVPTEGQMWLSFSELQRRLGAFFL